MDKTPRYINEVTRKTFIKDAASILIWHNHSGGSLEPSNKDQAATKGLAEACQSLENIKRCMCGGELFPSPLTTVTQRE